MEIVKTTVAENPVPPGSDLRYQLSLFNIVADGQLETINGRGGDVRLARPQQIPMSRQSALSLCVQISLLD